MEESIGQQLINKIRKSGEKHDLLVERHNYEKTLREIAIRLNHLPEDFASPTEKEIANILVKINFLKIEMVPVKDRSYTEYVMASPSN